LAALETEHEFAKIMRRQEAWGFTFDMDKALSLQARLQTTIADLEGKLIDAFGEWWVSDQVVRVCKTRRVKLTGFPDVTMERTSALGKPLKPYVGPPLCIFEEGATYTPITRVQFNPNSRDHVRLMLKRRYNWTPTKRTKKGTDQVNDEVLRALPYPEAQAIADYFSAQKISGFLTSGKKAWLKAAEEEGSEWRMHGRVNSVAGTYTYRVSCTDPNAANIPSRDEIFGPLCRDLFKAAMGFNLGGWDGSGVQLRLLAHYLHTWDHGAYCKVFEDGIDPHKFMRDAIGVDLMGEGSEGRKKGKTTNYAMCFGGGEKRLGFIIDPYATDARKTEIGRMVKERLVPTFGTAFDDLRAALRTRVENSHTLIGLDGRIGRPPSVHTGLSTLLQMGEAVVMKTAIVKFDKAMQAAGLLPGVDDCGAVHRTKADYEFAVHVYDEVQLDFREKHRETFYRLASWALAETGRELGVKCPLQADVQDGPSWAHTH
jgi:DNA polymerase-1